MARWLGLKDDPTAGGSTYDVLNTPGPVTIPDPDIWIPVTTATVDAGDDNRLDRNDEVRGRRGNTAPVSFAVRPKMSFEGRAYHKLSKAIVRKALGGAVTTTGTAPASITSKIVPIQANPVPCFTGKVLREEQIDLLSGLAVEQFELDLPADGEGTLKVDFRALYHDVPQSLPALPTPDFSGYTETYKLRDVNAMLGASLVKIPCLGGFSLTYNNSFFDDFKSLFCATENVRSFTVGGLPYKLWYPGRHKIGPQMVTGRLDFGNARPDTELKKILTVCEKLVIEVTAGPILPATTPAADELMRITLYKQAPTGGSADPLVREGDINSSYEFTAYIDETVSKDVEVEFVGKTALT